MKILKYFLVGGVAASVDIGLFYYFASHLGWPWLPVSIASFIIATLVNYFISIRFVFKSGLRYKWHLEIAGVFLVSGFALALNQLILYSLIEVFEWNLLLSKIVATAIVFFWNYFGRSKFIFTFET